MDSFLKSIKIDATEPEELSFLFHAFFFLVKTWCLHSNSSLVYSSHIIILGMIIVKCVTVSSFNYAIKNGVNVNVL